MVSVPISTLVQNVKANPQNVKIVSYSWYINPPSSSGSGNVLVVGEVQNMGSTVIDHINLEGIIYSSDGQAQGKT
jgi:hypothetical protein